jgi:hypothetical protein
VFTHDHQKLNQMMSAAFSRTAVRVSNTLAVRNHSLLGDLASPRSTSCSSYLVDPASSHMLVSKIKPCMSQYRLSKSETANGSLNQLWFLRSFSSSMDNCGNSRANTCNKPVSLQERALLLDQNQCGGRKAVAPGGDSG